jgi:hypothetical protein
LLQFAPICPILERVIVFYGSLARPQVLFCWLALAGLRWLWLDFAGFGWSCPQYEFFLSILTKSFRVITNQLFSACVESKKRKKNRPPILGGIGPVTSELKHLHFTSDGKRGVTKRF